jgi:hypothetical protein
MGRAGFVGLLGFEVQSNLDITISILQLFTNDTPRDRYIEVLISTKPSQIPRDYKRVICISKIGKHK